MQEYLEKLLYFGLQLLG